ncbi:bifunctional adenosylcobinamide kinase/adenosylcobinamide-phosphate guanylyltransferase [Cognatishimia sp. SS12]|uniref:bifunctional adenosylcobinamide kinase/adenosylcobinamide-phosphate guanylyltransferase n=1 Tax=Cognatishimia sp. SS12 TaxID=2979465 RepID=UPI00232F9020|nr:bifunctional adenosylcobinamide kinase/adenosylcobinamide-phosphate guanylyltransferase [Cognatishimia sp. SS12]MDC0739010.1 bifunctional adenosylcobinamide kinase/adenosylcobinamide-phosphate guanylyltransferase [Cognatishimia sp. SS12]
MLPKLTFVLGGAASGKSAFAEKLVNDAGCPKVYLATAQAFDAEMRAKISAHIAMRGAGWHTIEAQLDLAPALAGCRADQVVLLDCATMWLSNQLLAEKDVAEATAALLEALAACPGRIVLVSNEVGMGIVPDNALARQFREAQGKLNQQLAAAADLAFFVVAGLPQCLKGDWP